MGPLSRRSLCPVPPKDEFSAKSICGSLLASGHGTNNNGASSARDMAQKVSARFGDHSAGVFSALASMSLDRRYYDQAKPAGA
ncbi:hypothetical protein ACVWWG_001681 [Bradyrhizobium sp. LB7.2]